MTQHTPILTTEEPLRAPIQLPRRDRQRRPVWRWGWGMMILFVGWLFF